MPSPWHIQVNYVPYPWHIQVNYVPSPRHIQVNYVPYPWHIQVNYVPSPRHIQVNYVPSPRHKQVNYVPSPWHIQINYVPSPSCTYRDVKEKSKKNCFFYVRFLKMVVVKTIVFKNYRFIKLVVSLMRTLREQLLTTTLC